MFDATGHCDALHWTGKAIGLLDLDAFFASVEQLDHPEWRGLPIIVGGSPDKRGVVSTASYEARRYGVRSAMASATAARLCPDAIWTTGNFARYREVSSRVMAILVDETPLVEQVSIDEAFFDITPGRFSREEPYEVCARIQARVSELGVTCSIGLGTSKSIAKIASERDKPRGLTVVFPGSEQSFLAPLPIRSLSGIGSAAERALEAIGVRTLGAQGREQSVVASAFEDEDPKSVSCERTFETDLYDRAEIEAAILHIASMTGRRLRRKGLKGSTVTLKVKHSPTSQHTAQERLPAPSDDEHVFGPVARSLIGVGISRLDDEPGEQSLFDAERVETGRLARATDLVRDRFGEGAIGYGRDLRFDGHVSNTAPMGKSLD